MIRIVNEDIDSPQVEVEELMDKFVKFLKGKSININKVSYYNKTIYVDTKKDLVVAFRYLKTEFNNAFQLGIRVVQNIDVPGLNRPLPIDAMIDD